MGLIALVLSIIDVLAGLSLISGIWILSLPLALILLAKGLSGYVSALSSGLFFDIFSLADIISGFFLIGASAGIPIPFIHLMGIIQLIKGIIMVLLTIPYHSI